MQEFLINNTVHWNLMSLTGYRTLVILSALLESPKSNDEINECLFNNQYIKERFSGDTLRIYINSLRAIGCEITRADKSNSQKYRLVSHPFAYDIPKNQLNAISKLYKSTYDKMNLEEILLIEDFFSKLSSKLQNSFTKDYLKNISVIKNINRDLLDDLLKYCESKQQITFLYNSPRSGPKEITLVCDKLGFKSEKLYLYGNNLTHNEYSYFVVARILKICCINISKDKIEYPSFKIIYQLYNHDNYIPEPDEKIIESTNESLIIELTAKNEFLAMQRILFKTTDCKVLQPQEFKEKLLNKLIKMGEAYENV